MGKEAFSVPEMRLLSAREVLEIRRAVQAMEPADEQEKAMLGNAMVLAACCREGESSVFADSQAVLDRLTPAGMERLLTRFLALERGENGAPAVGGNPQFDETRYAALREG